jgi:predicted Zn-dependent protease
MQAESSFNELAAAIDQALAPGERHATSYAAEDTDFIRLNRGKVRQPGHVAQRFIEIRLIHGMRHASRAMSLSGELATDVQDVQAAVAALRSVLPDLTDDPHLLLPSTVDSTRTSRGGPLPPSAAMVETILDAANGHDLVGLLAAGPVYRGFANSDGQRNWHEVTTFNLQWSLYYRADKAVKAAYSGLLWDDAELRTRMATAAGQLGVIATPPKSLPPGKYRTYLAPEALQEVAQLLSFGGFSARALETQQSALAKMRTGAALDAHVHVSEDIATGVAPAFQADGFTRPPDVALINGGALVGALVSPRTAREFTLTANGANVWEAPEALAMRGGTLASTDALSALDTGLAVGNLWYLNYSDRPACRMTGMTRFATFWVEKGKIVAPVDVLRFDDTLYRMFGDNLEALTAERELLLESNTYGSRTLTSFTLPGALLSELNYTL